MTRSFIKLTYSAIIICLLFGNKYSNGQTSFKHHIKISAHFSGLKDGYYYLNSAGKVGIDSCRAKNGKLTFNYFGETDGLHISSVNDNGNDGSVFSTPIFLVDTNDVVLEGNANEIYLMKVSGSIVNEKAQRMQAQLKPLSEQRNNYVINNKPLQADSIERLITNVYKYEVVNNVNSSYGMMMLYYLALHKSVSLKEVESLLNRFHASLSNSKWTMAVKSWIKNSISLNIGAIAPGFTQPGVDGRTLSLFDYRGKYVLLEFWSSWCGPCRDENPRLVETYKRFSAYGFEIIAVSIDVNRQAWLAAIKKDNLIWPQLSDLKGQFNEVAVLYNVSSIPSNFLINPNGQIVAQNLRGDKLTEKLSEIFEKKK